MSKTTGYTRGLAASMADIAARGPSEALGPESRYVIVADLRMGDGGKKDELAGSRKALFSILSRWYLPRGYTLVLNGDIEDLRGFWLKDILAAWPEMYALFDVFAERGRLRKIVGERDLALLRLASYPYELSHCLRLDGERGSILVLHGHQASPPYVGRDYLSDYIVHWLGSSKRPKPEAPDKDGRERFKAERRLYRAASRLGIVAIEGHTRRPLFESLTNRDSVRAEVERLLRGSDPRAGASKVDALVDLYRKESRKGSGSPCLFSPGRVVGARGLRVLEVDQGSLLLARWSKSERARTAATRADPTAPPPQSLEGSAYKRYELRSTSIAGLLERVQSVTKLIDGKAEQSETSF